MLVPISWLKEFVEIKLPLPDLMWKMTEAGLTCESSKKVGDEIILDVEVTANRPDWMSIIGIAREVAAIQGIKLKEPKVPELPEKSANFPIDLVPDFDLFERWTAVAIKGIEIKSSPKWLADRIRQMGHDPINNIIDITNYVMYETGIPMHAFDYDEISGQIMTVQKSKGGEAFTSVDGDDYILPKDAIIIRDSERLIDLAGIKGGLNSGIKDSTKNVFLHVTIDNPVLVRRASITLGLRSDASAIYERGPDKGATITAIKRAAALMLELAGGEIASDLIDLKKHDFNPQKLILNPEKMDRVLGIKIPETDAVKILNCLNLSPKKVKDKIECLVPTVRADVKIEEDLIEEVARIYGYNKFPKTLPVAKTVKEKAPYSFDDSLILKLKDLMVSSGFSETMTLSLISKDSIEKFELDPEKHTRILNPVSLEYEFMKASLIPSLVSSLNLNNRKRVLFFEVAKIYPSENYKIAVAAKGIDFRQFKGTLDLILERLHITGYKIDFEANAPFLHPSKGGKISKGKEVLGEFGFLSPQVSNKLGAKDEVLCFELDIKTLEKYAALKNYEPVPENPPQTEDLTLTLPPKTRILNVTNLIIDSNKFIKSVEYVGDFKGNYTFHITYQHPSRTLTNDEVAGIRDKYTSSLKTKFGASVK